MKNITISSIRCVLQVALLGAVTPNLRAVNANFDENNIELFFYYENPPSEDEEELSSVIETEVYSDFIDISIVTERIVLPASEKIPEKQLMIFLRKE
jgi:hypothetical protein